MLYFLAINEPYRCLIVTQSPLLLQVIFAFTQSPFSVPGVHPDSLSAFSSPWARLSQTSLVFEDLDNFEDQYFVECPSVEI